MGLQLTQCSHQICSNMREFMHKYLLILGLILLSLVMTACSSRFQPLNDDSGSSPEPPSEVPDDSRSRNNPPDDSSSDDPTTPERTHDPTIGLPAPDSFFVPNPCGGSPNQLCVLAPMHWNLRVFGNKVAQLPFLRNVETGPEYKIHTYITSRAIHFRIMNTGLIYGTNHKSFHTIFYGYPSEMGRFLLTSTSPVIAPRLHADISSFGRFQRQEYDLAFGVVRHHEDKNHCDYKAIFYVKNTDQPIAHLSGTGICDISSF